MATTIFGRVGLIIGVTALTLGLGAAGAIGQDVVKERQDLMKTNGRAIGTLFRAIRAGEPLDPAMVAGLAATMRVAATKIPDLFPSGSTSEKALPAIWEKPDEFKMRAAAFGQAAAALERAARENKLGDGKELTGAVAARCTACHDMFQKPDR